MGVIDDPLVVPKLKLEELVKITDHGEAIYRIKDILGNLVVLEKI